MGLDIYLIRIIEKPKLETAWLSEKENPELNSFSDLITERTTELENGTLFAERGYYYDEISYQRKGVKPIFFKKFGADDFIFTNDKLLELKKCVKKEYFDSFESDFMQKFKEKENLIMISY